MISFLTGQLIHWEASTATVLVQGVGYEVELPPAPGYTQSYTLGDTVELHTHLIVREDAQSLVGFRTRQERDLFRILIKASGVGPKLALNILAQVDAASFVKAIEFQDRSLLSSIKGVGAKLVDKMLLELKSKVIDWSPDVPTNQDDGQAQEAIMALQSLGYKPQQARTAVAKVCQEHPQADTSAWIKLALQALA